MYCIINDIRGKKKCFTNVTQAISVVLLSDGCCWKIDGGLGPVALQVASREKPKL